MNRATRLHDYSQCGSYIDHRWNWFWFTPRPDVRLVRLRQAVGLASIYYFLTWVTDATQWFGVHGFWPRALAANVATDFGREWVFRFSLFQVFDAPVYIRLILALAVLNAILLVVGKTYCFWSALLNLLAILSCVHRASLLTGPFEAVLVLLGLYICISPADRAPKSKLNPSRIQSGIISLRANLAVRLMQVHVTLIYLTAGLNMLAADTWWRGTAAWDLVSLPESRVLDITFLFAFPAGIYLLNIITHMILVYHLVFPILVWNRQLRRVLLDASWLLWCLIAVISGQWSYAALMATASYLLWEDSFETSGEPLAS